MRIINAAIQVIAKKLSFGSISDIAKVASVADGTIYLYFKNKIDLTTIFEKKMEELIGWFAELDAITGAEKRHFAIEQHFYKCIVIRSWNCCRLNRRQTILFMLSSWIVVGILKIARKLSKKGKKRCFPLIWIRLSFNGHFLGSWWAMFGVLSKKMERFPASGGNKWFCISFGLTIK